MDGHFDVGRVRGIIAVSFLALLVSGCGTTKWSDSPRTATEQLLISDAVDRAISEIDYSALADRSVYLDTRYIITTIDQNYVTSTMRQHMLASGCVIKDKADDAEYIVEIRTGTLGTNRQDVLLGMPATNLPTGGVMGVNASIPEIALSKRTNQQAICKIAVFAYDRMTGRPVWQSGNRKVASNAKDTWVLGTGPFQRGTIYDGTVFAGEKVKMPLVKSKQASPATSVAKERRFGDGPGKLDDTNKVLNAGYAAPLPAGGQAQPLPAAATAPAPLAAPTKTPGAATPAPAAAVGAPAAGAPAATTPPAPQKAAYTPPPPPPVPVPVVPPPPPTGPQGNLPQSAFTPPVNPAATTDGAIKTYNLARDLLEKN